jgi:hypothetical protein
MRLAYLAYLENIDPTRKMSRFYNHLRDPDAVGCGAGVRPNRAGGRRPRKLG